MEEGDVSFYTKEADRLKLKVEGLFLNIDEFRLKPTTGDLAPSSNQITSVSLDSGCNADLEDGMLEIDEDLLTDFNCWFLDKNEEDRKPETVCQVSLDGDGNDVEVSDVIQSLKESNMRQLPLPISTKTFARPKKGRTSLSNMVTVSSPPVEVGSPKLRRRLTTTVVPTPAIIPHLEQLSRTNNRPLSNCEDLNWEDGEDMAKEGEAPAEASDTTPRRPVVPASLLQRLQELKETNAVRSSPFQNRPRPHSSVLAGPPPASILSLRPTNPMTVSQLMREIPDLENPEPESYLSLGDTSLLSLGESQLSHLNRYLDEMGQDRRMTFGGVELPPGRPRHHNKTFVAVEQLVEVSELNSTFTKNDSDHSALYVTNPVFDEEIGDENRNTDAVKVAQILKGYSSKLFDQTFPKTEKNEENLAKQVDVILNGTFDKKNGVELKIFDAAEKGVNGIAENNLEKEVHSVGANGTFTQVEHVSAFTRMEHNSSVVRTERITQSKEEEVIHIKEGLSREDLNDPQPYQYSTATYSRPSARFSPARSGLPMRRVSSGSLGNRLSCEDLARSPARSDGTVTPVDVRPAHGTYTRNSPVERCGSEDEQMSTTSDHSMRSQDSVEDLPEGCKTGTAQPGKRKMSTPRGTMGAAALDGWAMSPISRHQGSMTPASSNERLGAVRVIQKLPHGPVPLKPALIRPTDNFKRPVVKKNETNTTQSSARAPVRPGALKAPAGSVSGLPKPAGRAIPTRIPGSRLSSIPRPPSSRLSGTSKTDS